MYCRECGKLIEDGSKDICNECEAKLNTTTMGQENVQVVSEVSSQNNGGSQNNYNVNNVQSNVNSENQKSKIAAGLLGIFLGALGVHNFYLGYTGKAIAQLLISILSCGILAFASSIWGLIEGILILTGSINKDANGVPLKD